MAAGFFDSEALDVALDACKVDRERMDAFACRLRGLTRDCLSNPAGALDLGDAP